jgi:glycosyltransferase involved in cell wall biosynthesis
MSADARAALPTRILLLLPTLQGGGAERVMLNLLRNFDRSRFEPMLAVVDGRLADLAGELPQGVRFEDLQCTRVGRAGPRIVRLIWRWRPQVVLSTVSHLNLMLALLKPLLPRSTRLVAREAVNLSTYLREEVISLPWRLGFRWFYRRFDRVICLSRSMRDDLCTHFSLVERKTVVIPNPVDGARLRELGGPAVADRDDPARRLVAIGRLAHQKGFDLLIDALARCRDLAWQLDVLGKGPAGLELQQQIERLGLQDRVRLRGFVANPYTWLRQADALVLSSRYEGMPNVVLEALACGTPVVSTPVPGAVEILRGSAHAELTDDFTAASIETALRTWFARPLARVPSKAVSDYGIAHITRRYEEVLADATRI